MGYFDSFVVTKCQAFNDLILVETCCLFLLLQQITTLGVARVKFHGIGGNLWLRSPLVVNDFS